MSSAQNRLVRTGLPSHLPQRYTALLEQARSLFHTSTITFHREAPGYSSTCTASCSKTVVSYIEASLCKPNILYQAPMNSSISSSVPTRDTNTSVHDWMVQYAPDQHAVFQPSTFENQRANPPSRLREQAKWEAQTLPVKQD